MTRDGATRPSTHQLFWRIFLHGLLLLAAVTAVSLILIKLFGGIPEWRQFFQRTSELIARDMAPGDADQMRLRDRLASLHYVTRAAYAVYTEDGRMMAGAGDPPAAATADELETLRAAGGTCHHGRGRWTAALPERPGMTRAYVVVEWGVTGGPTRLLLGLAAALLVVALMSVPLARRLARPLDRITVTARRIGSGDLAARTGIARHGEVGVLARTLDEMAERLEARIRGEKELVANVSHEIRTPLARIKVALELCDEEGVGEAEIRGQLAGITGDVAELERLLDDVLVLARLDLRDTFTGSGEPVLRLERVAVGSIVEAAAERFVAAHSERALEIAVDPAAPFGDADPVLLRRALDNLLENAVKYSPPGSPIELRAEKTPGGVAVEVRDRGMGIAPEDLPRIFDPFFRTDRSRSRGTGGIGLGLTLCKRIADAHGGRLSASSREDGGTVFRLELPAVDPSTPSGGSVTP